MWSPYRSPCQHTTSQSQNGPNYHTHLGILSAADPPDPHYKNPPQVFELSQQTLVMERHQTFHYLFNQILSQRLWKNLNQEVHIRHLPPLLP